MKNEIFDFSWRHFILIGISLGFIFYPPHSSKGINQTVRTSGKCIVYKDTNTVSLQLLKETDSLTMSFLEKKERCDVLLDILKKEIKIDTLKNK